jgi:hypothetical protein
VEAVEARLHAAPQPEGATPLLYRLDRLRAGAPELAELALLDALHSGAVELPGEQRAAATRLLGDDGDGPAARLGCPPGTAPGALAGAARAQGEQWQRAQWHPASTAGTRAAAEVLVRTCEALAARVGAGVEGPAERPAEEVSPAAARR